jgi:hypothetical protein
MPNLPKRRIATLLAAQDAQTGKILLVGDESLEITE